MSELVWRTPTVEPLWHVALDEQRMMIEDRQRMMVEDSMFHFHTGGIGVGDTGALAEAMRHWTVDLLDMGHTPSRRMMRMISAGLKAWWWPGDKEAKRNEQALWLVSVQNMIDDLAATEYRDSDAPRTCAEEAVAGQLGLSVDGLRQNKKRYRAQLRKSAAEAKAEEMRRFEAQAQLRRERRSKQ